jgi:putative ABC transport system substrate-binding protein
LNRRTFIGTLTGGLLAAPRGAKSQQAAKIARVGDLFIGPPLSPQQLASPTSVSRALREFGWVEGQNLLTERRLAQSDDEAKLAAADLVRLKVDVIIVWSNGLAKLVQTETKTIPIVVIGAGPDLVSGGLVASLARPGGNLTGQQILSEDLIPKRLELLQVVVPTLSRVAFLKDRIVSIPEAHARYMQTTALAARALRMELHPFIVLRPEDLPTAFQDMTKNGDKGLLVASSPFIFSHRKQIADLAATHRIPSIYDYREYLEAGGLISYGANIPDLRRRGAVYVDRILRGANPADLPIEQPTKFELVINLKTAKALGLTIPPSLLARADQVIE